MSNQAPSFIPRDVQPYLTGAVDLAAASGQAAYQMSASLTGLAGRYFIQTPVSWFASYASSGAASGAIESLTAQGIPVQTITNALEAVQALKSPTLAAKKQAYAIVSAYIQQALNTQNQDQAPYNDPATGLSVLLEKNNELKALLNNPATTEVDLDAKFQELIQKLETANIFIHGTSLHTPSQDILTAPTLEQLRQNHAAIIEAPVQATEPVDHTQEARNESLKKELKTFTTSLRRTLEMQFLLPNATPSELSDLKNHITSPEDIFHRKFKEALRTSINKSNLLSFLRPIYHGYLLCLHFILQQFTHLIFNKINSFLDKKITDFTKSEKTQIMELITNILCDGFQLYTCEFLNICHELNTAVKVDGTPDTMFEMRLREKATLHKGMSQQKFYLHALDRILKYCFDLSITRYVLKKLIEYSGFLNNPFLSLPQAIKTNNGYFHAIDKAVVKFITPIIQKMTEQPAPLREVSEQEESNETKTFTNYNKESLKKAIASLFEASDIHQASNLSEIKQIANRSKKSDHEKTFLENAGLSPDAILKQTAEAGAVALLQNISEVLDQSFLEEQAINALKTLNEVFKATTPITDSECQTAERERKDIFNTLTQTIIANAVDKTPILNTEDIVSKLNREIAQTKEIAEAILRFFQLHIDSEEAATYPHQLIEKDILTILQTLEENLNKAANTIGFSEHQKQALMAPCAEIKKYVNRFQKAYQPTQQGTADPQTFILTEAKATLAAFKESINSNVFALYQDTSILNNPTVKKVAKFAVNLMLKQKFNQAYEFICDFKTIKYCVIHQGVLARV